MEKLQPRPNSKPTRTEQAKNIFESIKQYIKKAYTINRYKTKFRQGLLSPTSKEYLQYIDAAWENKGLRGKYESFQKAFDDHFKPFAVADARDIERKHEQILFALKSLRPIELIPTGDFKISVEKQVKESLAVAIEQEREKLRQEMERKLSDQLSEKKAALANKEKTLSLELRTKAEQEKAKFYEKILPFTTGEAASDNDVFISKDFQRLAALEQGKKQRELEELQKEISYQKREQHLEEKKIELYGQRLNLDYTANEQKITAKQQELRSQKIELDTLGQRIDISAQKLSLQAEKIESAKKILILEVQEKEMLVERKLMELANTAVSIQQEKKDVELQQKHIEIINLLSDYEMKTREFDLVVTQKLLDVKDQQVTLRGDQVEQRIKEAETALNQQQTKLEIEGKLLELQDREFSHKANETLFEIERNRHDVENKIEKLDLKEQGVEILFREKSIEVETAYSQLIKKENDLTLSKMEMLEEHNRLMGRLELAEHKILNAQNKTAYLQAGKKGNMWSTLAFLWGNRKGIE